MTRRIPRRKHMPQLPVPNNVPDFRGQIDMRQNANPPITPIRTPALSGRAKHRLAMPSPPFHKWRRGRHTDVTTDNTPLLAVRGGCRTPSSRRRRRRHTGSPRSGSRTGVALLAPVLAQALPGGVPALGLELEGARAAVPAALAAAANADIVIVVADALAAPPGTHLRAPLVAAAALPGGIHAGVVAALTAAPALAAGPVETGVLSAAAGAVRPVRLPAALDAGAALVLAGPAGVVAAAAAAGAALDAGATPAGALAAAAGAVALVHAAAGHARAGLALGATLLALGAAGRLDQALAATQPVARGAGVHVVAPAGLLVEVAGLGRLALVVAVVAPERALGAVAGGDAVGGHRAGRAHGAAGGDAGRIDAESRCTGSSRSSRCRRTACPAGCSC